MARRQLLSGYDCEFIEKPPKPFQYECPVCLLILREPYQATCCGYSFCRACIKQIKTSSHAELQCPCCKKVDFHSYPNKGLQRSLNELRVLCANQKKGCEWIGELGKMDDHLDLGSPSLLSKGCQYVDVKCIYCSESMRRLDIQAHVKEDCRKRPYSCNYCGNYDSDFEDVSTNHIPVCGLYPVDCPNKCGRVIQRQYAEKHISNECPMTVVDCAFKIVGCSVRLPEKDMPTHIAESVSAHLLLQMTSYKQLVTRLEEENKILKKDNKLLHQRLDKQQLQITVLTEHLQTLHSTPVAPVNFIMVGFDAHRRDGTSWFSPPFYTHLEGYKMYMEIDANGYGEGEGTHVSVYISLMRGEFDNQLPWPFRGNVTINFLNQMLSGDEEEPDYTDILPFNHEIPRRYTSRVVDDEYPDDVYGFDMFCSHADLVPAYLSDDCLRVCIEVDTHTY